MENQLTPRIVSFSPEVHPPIPLLDNTLPPISTTRTYQSERTTGLRNHLETLRDVESAFHNADIALRHAREALRNDAIMSSRFGSAGAAGRPYIDANNIVDLTTIPSDTSNEDPDVQWSHTRHPNDSQIRVRRTGLPSHLMLRPFPNASNFGPVEPLTHFHNAHPAHHLGTIASNHRTEESAIRRQRQARRDWERVERRNTERAAQQAQRDNVEQARRLADQAPLNHDLVEEENTNDRRTRRNSASSTASSISLTSQYSLDSEDTNPTNQQNTQDTSDPSQASNSTMPPTEAIDLTTLDDQATIKDRILSLQQQTAIAAQKQSANVSNDPASAVPHATPLSTYRCAICMDTPSTATTTICGHLFCHNCLKDSLKWSAQQRRDDAGLHGRRAPNAGTGLCPVCRKVLSDKEGGSKPGLVGLEIKMVSRKEWERRKKQEHDDQERDEFLHGLAERNDEDHKGKGKGKERVSGYMKSESHSEDQGFEASRLAKGKSARKRRREEEPGEY